jgi:catechol 2,3-dioxygenase-like lactoylglutathione lyase family enzyme
MQFKYTIFYVEDVNKTLDFYIKAFGLKLKMQHQSGDYAELDTGSTTLSFSSMHLMNELGKSPVLPNANRPCFEIAFETEDVAKALDLAVQAGAQLVQSPSLMPWGQTTAYVTDLNGYLVEICTATT